MSLLQQKRSEHCSPMFAHFKFNVKSKELQTKPFLVPSVALFARYIITKLVWKEYIIHQNKLSKGKRVQGCVRGKDTCVRDVSPTSDETKNNKKKWMHHVASLTRVGTCPRRIRV